MGCCANCLRGSCLGIVSICSLGVIALVLIILTILIAEQNIKEVSNTIYICFIVADVIVCAVLAFAIYASCCGHKTANKVLGYILGILGLILLVFGILVLAYKNSLKSFATKLFIFGTDEYKKNEKGRVALAKTFKCSYAGQGTIDYETKGSCLEIVNEKFDDYATAIGAVLIIFACILFGATIVALCYGYGKLSKKNPVAPEP